MSIHSPANAALLDSICYPHDLQNLSLTQLEQLAAEVRQEVINIVSKTGGHLGASLGVVELTVALHHVFDTPDDKLIWDVGHQCYPHKILTGRRLHMDKLRQKDGPSGFTKRSESEYDPFGAGHSSTSISAALGMAAARDLQQETRNIIAVIGDGAISAGMAYEALNNAGHLPHRLIVILNDNEMSIAPAVGAMTNYLARLTSSSPYLGVRNLTKKALHHCPALLKGLVYKTKKYAKDLVTGGNFFEELGFHYIGSIDGHDLATLVPVLRNLKDCTNIDSPILLHIKTEKGRGFGAPEGSVEKYHAVSKFNRTTKIQEKTAPTAITYTKAAAMTLLELARIDEKVVAITAAMPTSTGLDKMAELFPQRVFDVGIAEQHAVTFAAGLATGGLKPFVAIYSTFLQRAYDQIIHDVAIQKLPVRFLIDRAGLVGADGATHAGSFDLAYLGVLPDFIIMAPSDELELAQMIITSHGINDAPSAVRFPRGEGVGVNLPANLGHLLPLPIGKGKIITQGSQVAVLSLGARLGEVHKAAALLNEQLGIQITIADARFLKPLDTELLCQLAEQHDILLTIEEGAIGGFATHVTQFLLHEGYLERGLRVRNLFLPDKFLDHDKPEALYAGAGLDAGGIAAAVKKMIFATL